MADVHGAAVPHQDDGLVEHIGRLELDGYSVVRAALSPAECADTKAALLVLASEPEPNLHYLYNKGEAFERVYASAGGQQIHAIARHFLGEDACLGDVEGRVSAPGGARQNLHVDGAATGPYQTLPPGDVSGRIVSHMLQLRMIWCLTPFAPNNPGTTVVVPGSHRDPTLPVEPHPRADELAIVANPGDVLLYSSATHHAFGGSSDAAGVETRVAILCGWQRSWLWKGWSFPPPAPAVVERAGERGELIFGLQIRKQQERRLGGLSKAQQGQSGARGMADALLRAVDFDVEEAIRILRVESRL
jgi:ectoine hydroxylase-related dioxygenase (phytanoyl-CoA dioxygenase family)